ncbi:hypothetical protein [Marinicauda salina]|nr:hypothetical protein [Marinicauda salina]
MNRARTTTIDAALGRAVLTGVARGGAVMAAAGVAIGMGLQAAGVLPQLSAAQMALFTVEVAAVGALFEAARLGRRARKGLDG